MNLGDHFVQSEYHTDIRGIELLRTAIASDLTTITVNSIEMGDTVQGALQAVKEFDIETLGGKDTPGWAKEYVEHSGLGDLLLIELADDYPGEIRYFRCGHCRWHWRPSTGYDNKCPRCGFVAPLETYSREEEKTAETSTPPAPPEEYHVAVKQFFDIDVRRMTRKLGIPLSVRGLVKAAYLLKIGSLPLEEFRERMAQAAKLLLESGYRKSMRALDNLEDQFPVIAREEAALLSTIRKHIRQNKSQLRR
jgi:phage FluMu protein Com